MKSTPVGRIVIRPSDETKAIIGITKGADQSLKPGMVYEIRKDDSGVMTLHEVGESCIRGPVAAEDTRQDAVFSWAHDLGLIFDAMGVDVVATATEREKISNLLDVYEKTVPHLPPSTRRLTCELLGHDFNPQLFFFRGIEDTRHGYPVIAAAHSKPKEVEKALEEIFCLLDDGDFDATQLKLEEVKEKYANVSELARAKTSLDRKRHYSRPQ